jgi:hypothetical protein
LIQEGISVEAFATGGLVDSDAVAAHVVDQDVERAGLRAAVIAGEQLRVETGVDEDLPQVVEIFVDLDPVFSELIGNAGRMHFTGDDFDGLAVNRELSVGRGKLVGFTIARQGRGSPGGGAANKTSHPKTQGNLN